MDKYPAPTPTGQRHRFVEEHIEHVQIIFLIIHMRYHQASAQFCCIRVGGVLLIPAKNTQQKKRIGKTRHNPTLTCKQPLLPSSLPCSVFWSLLEMPPAALDHLWAHESSGLPGVSYTALGPSFPGVPLKTWISNISSRRHNLKTVSI